MDAILDWLGKFFTVAFRGQTYLNALYLLLSFPLGIFYFVFLVVGLAVGFPLIIVWVGLLLLAAVFAAWYALIVFERQMAIWMLHEDIQPVSKQDLSGKNLWQKFTATLTNPVTWKGLVYLFAKFPLGIISFTLLVTFVAVSASLLGMPFYYQAISPQINISMDLGVWSPILSVDTISEAMLVCLVGVFVTLISMHILNGLAWVSGKFAKVMLGSYPVASMQPLAPALAVAPAAQPAQPAAVEPDKTDPNLEQI